MKLAIDILNANSSVESQLIANTLPNSAIQQHLGWFKSGYYTCIRLFKALLLGSIKRYLINMERSFEFSDDYDSLESGYYSRYSSRLWKRHSALLIEAEKWNSYQKEKAVYQCDDVNNPSRDEHGTVSLYVSGIDSLPVWASQLDEIGIINKQL